MFQVAEPIMVNTIKSPSLIFNNPAGKEISCLIAGISLPISVDILPCLLK